MSLARNCRCWCSPPARLPRRKCRTSPLALSTRCSSPPTKPSALSRTSLPATATCSSATRATGALNLSLRHHTASIYIRSPNCLGISHSLLTYALTPQCRQSLILHVAYANAFPVSQAQVLGGEQDDRESEPPEVQPPDRHHWHASPEQSRGS